MAARSRSSPRALLRHHAAPAVVLAIGLTATIAAWLYVRDLARSQVELRFRDLAEQSTATLQERMEAYAAMMRGTRGLFEVLGVEPAEESFRTFVSNLDLRTHYPGIQGIGWSKVLLPGDLSAHVEHERAAGRPEYRVWPEGERDLYSSIVRLEPLDWRNQRAIGFDMFSEATRREAMVRARDTGELTASGKVELVQESGSVRQAGFLVYLPVYAGMPKTVAERREALRGWVFAPFRTADLLHGALGAAQARTVGIAVHDGGEASPETLLHDAGVPDAEIIGTLQERIQVGGRTWTLRYAASRAFASAAERTVPGGVLAGGIAVTLLLFLVTRGERGARVRAERAARRTAFLAEAGQALSSSLDYRRTLPQVAQLAAGWVTDLCVIHVRERAAPLWFAAHRDPDLAARTLAALEAYAVHEDLEMGPGAALATGAPRVRNDLDLEHLAFAERAPQLAALFRDLRARATLTMPLFARGEPLGAITFVAQGGRIGRDDVSLAADLGRLVTAAVDTARLYARAQAAIRQRDEFLSVASHELRTPLTSLTLQSESLRARAARGGAPDLAQKADVIRRSVERLTRLVSSLLDLSRITAGRLDIELEEVDLAALAREVTERFAEEARRSGCELRVDAPEPVVGRWDRLRLDQVATNLVSNAIKYGPGKPVEVRVLASGARAILSVRDHGIGISEADQARIFERFERAVSERNYGGFGLGLWIVKQVVEALGGTVRVESAPGKGSTFVVELERAEGSRDEATTSPPTPPEALP